MKRKPNINITADTVLDMIKCGPIRLALDANDDIINYTKGASKDNPVRIGDYLFTKPMDPDIDDIGITMVIASACLEEICALRDEIKSLKKTLKKQAK